jgi:hypothetical protein
MEYTAEIAGLHITRSRSEMLQEARDMCVGPHMFSITWLNPDITVSVAHPLSSSSTLPQR